MEIHARYGGVFPEVASRQHVLSIVPVIEQTLSQSNLTLKDIDAIAVTRGPGLAGSLVVGMNTGKGTCAGDGPADWLVSIIWRDIFIPPGSIRPAKQLPLNRNSR